MPDARRRTIGSMLNEIERVLNAATTPPFNKQGAKFRGIVRYRQVPYVEPPITFRQRGAKVLDRIGKKVDRLS